MIKGSFFVYFVTIHIGVVFSQGLCPTINGQTETCIPVLQCPTLAELLRKRPISPENRQLLKDSQCGWSKESNQPMVCCPPSTPTVTSKDQKTSQNLLPGPGVCGVSSTNRIFGGTKTQIDEYPWLVLLEYLYPSGRKSFLCGGSLINDKYILTAAHCIDEPSVPEKLVSVRLGEWDTSTTTDCDISSGTPDCAPPHIDVEVEEQIAHPNYDPKDRNVLNDIALLRLSRTVNFTDFIQPICLPDGESFRILNYTNNSFVVAGWGKTETGFKSTTKLKVKVDGVDKETCTAAYQKSLLNITNMQICAGGEKGKDSCGGDSGGPLMINKRAANGLPYFFISGIVSYGLEDCGLKGVPGVYTRVDKYVDWIKQKIRE